MNIILLLCLLGSLVALIHSFLTQTKFDVTMLQLIIIIIIIVILLVAHDVKSVKVIESSKDIQELFTSEIRKIISDDNVLVEVPELLEDKSILPVQIGDKTYIVKYKINHKEIEISQIIYGREILYDLDLNLIWEVP